MDPKGKKNNLKIWYLYLSTQLPWGFVGTQLDAALQEQKKKKRVMKQFKSKNIYWETNMKNHSDEKDKG